MQRTSIYFDTEQYEHTHAHAPRGRGSWAFAINAGALALMPLSDEARIYNDLCGSRYPRISHIDPSTYPRKLLIWFQGDAQYTAAKRAVRLVLIATARRVFAAGTYASICVEVCT